MNDEVQREAERDDPRMRDPAEIAAEREYHRDCRREDATQREWWGVIGQHEARPQTCESKAVAEATRVFYDSHYPALAPHRVLRLVEQPA